MLNLFHYLTFFTYTKLRCRNKFSMTAGLYYQGLSLIKQLYIRLC